MTASDTLARATSEADLQELVIEMAHHFGWAVVHFGVARTEKGWRTPARADAAGFVDLILVRDRVIFAELKTEKGHLRPEQREWFIRLRAAGVTYRLWRPSDIDSIEDELR